MAEETDGGVGVADGSEEFEEIPEASSPEEGEVGHGVPEARAEGQRHLPVHPPPVEGSDQLPYRHIPMRRRGRRKARPRRLVAAAAHRLLLQVHSVGRLRVRPASSSVLLA